MCWGSFGIDPDIFGFTNPTFYIHHTQIDLYCSLAGQNSELVKPIFHSSDYRDVEDEQHGWMSDVGKPVLEFLTNVDEHCLYAQVPEEMVIQLSGPEIVNMNDDKKNCPTT